MLAQVLVSLLLFAAIFLLIYALFRYPVPAEPEIHRRIALAIGADKRDSVFEQPLTRPVMALSLATSHRLRLGPVRDRIRRHLDAAGNPGGYSVDEYLAICLVCAALLAAVSGLFALMLLGSLQPLIIFFMAAVGFYAPLWSLAQAARARMSRIGKQLPYTLDLIALTMAAGSSFTEAVETMVRDRPEEDLNQELRIVESEIDFGTPRGAALTNMAERVPLDSLRSVVGAVNQAEALGSPLSTILKNQSGMLRTMRSVAAEKKSASASLRILIPSMLILIAVVLTLFGPMIIRWITFGSVF